MLVLMLGGPLDGELREVPTESIVDGKAVLLGDAQRITGPGEPWLYTYRDHTYHIANGIARHESVGEEEVARRVHGLMNPVDNYIDGVVAPTIQRYMRPKFPMGE